MLGVKAVLLPDGVWGLLLPSEAFSGLLEARSSLAGLSRAEVALWLLAQRPFTCAPRVVGVLTREPPELERSSGVAVFSRGLSWCL